MYKWKETLERIKKECSAKGWDSYEANPISIPALGVAETLLKSVEDLGLPEPHISPENSGGIYLEWYDSTDKYNFVVQIDSNGLDDNIGIYCSQGNQMLAATLMAIQHLAGYMSLLNGKSDS